MATTVARLEAILSANTRDFDRDLDKADSKFSRVGRGLAKGALVAGVAVGTGLAVGAKKAVDAASNLEESVNAVNVVFGKASKRVLSFSEDAARKAGLSMREFNQLVTPIGASLQNVGLSADQAARQSIKLTQRAADMASVFNVDVKEALGAIQAGLRGEADPLERFGVGLNDAAVKAKALSMGLAGSEKEITAQDKAAARLGLIYEQTNKVAGDFANTSGSLANQKRILRAEVENLGAKVGQVLLPVITEGVKLVNRFLPVLDTWGQKLGGVADVVRNNFPAIRQIAANVFDWMEQHVFPIIRSLRDIFVAAIGKIREVLDANGPELRRIFDRLGAAIEAIAKIAIPILRVAFVEVLPRVLNAAIIILDKTSAAVEGIIKAIKWLGEHAAEMLSKVWSAAKKPLDALADGFKLVWGFIDKIVDGIKWLIDKIPNIPKISIPGIGGDPFDPRKMLPPQGPVGRGPLDISPRLYDELSMAKAMGLVLTSGYRPGAITRSGTPSDHGVYPSKAIDVSGSAGSMARFFTWLIGQADVKQAFYDPLGSIFGGRLSSYREGGHSDHVHVATYDKGGWLKPGLTLAANYTGRPEPVGFGGTVNFNFPNYVGSKNELIGWIQSAAAEFKRRNGRGLV